ncbi:hypothetical protein Sango_1809700 [Sesamum angolense]|uniref:TPM domain-containing protein n=1 Tax=Sesamum angolense TaxID=2727404 RepID=A0AAE1WHJ8_9LAMI|nr:hypothetical protein Sango_1809700 [Sesamum angolense]
MILDLEIWHFVLSLYVMCDTEILPAGKRPLLLSLETVFSIGGLTVFLRAHELAFQCAPGTSSTCHFFGPQLSLLILTDSALASEFDVLNEGPPKESYVVDDAGVLSQVTKSDLKRLLSDLGSRKGYHINVVTVRKHTSKADAFEYADQVLECWYPTVEECNKKGIVVLITSQKEGAVIGGPEFIQALGDSVLDGTKAFEVLRDTDEQCQKLYYTFYYKKYNEAVFSSANVVAAIEGYWSWLRQQRILTSNPGGDR